MSEDSENDDDVVVQKTVTELPLAILPAAEGTRAPHQIDTSVVSKTPSNVLAVPGLVSTPSSKDFRESPNATSVLKTPPGVLHALGGQDGTAVSCAPPGVWHPLPAPVPELPSSAEARARQRRPGKCQCHFLVGIEEDPEFRVVFRIIGPSGAKVKAVASQTGAKLRLRGRGTNFVEGSERKVSTDDLMLCVSAPTTSQLVASTNLVRQILECVYADYDSHRASRQLSPLHLRVQMHYGPRKGAR